MHKLYSTDACLSFISSGEGVGVGEAVTYLAPEVTQRDHRAVVYDVLTEAIDIASVILVEVTRLRSHPILGPHAHTDGG